MSRLKFRSAGVVAALVAAAAALTVSASPASADPDNLPILHAGSNGFAHQCKNIGDDGFYQAIICADIETGVTSDSTYHAVGQIEAFCEKYKTSTIVGCAAVTIDGALESGAGLATPTYDGCGSIYGLNPCAPDGQRNYYLTNNYEYSYGNAGSCDTNLSSTNQVYSVDFGLSGGNVRTEVYLPNGDHEVLASGNDGANMSSGHFFVCP